MNQPRDRRQFLKILALGGAMPLVGRVSGAFAQGSPATPANPAGTPTPPAPVASPALAAPSADVPHLRELLRLRYGSFLSEEQLKSLEPDLDRMVGLGKRLRASKLLNSQEPDVVFRAVREDGR